MAAGEAEDFTVTRYPGLCAPTFRPATRQMRVIVAVANWLMASGNQQI